MRHITDISATHKHTHETYSHCTEDLWFDHKIDAQELNATWRPKLSNDYKNSSLAVIININRMMVDMFWAAICIHIRISGPVFLIRINQACLWIMDLRIYTFVVMMFYGIRTTSFHAYRISIVKSPRWQEVEQQSDVGMERFWTVFNVWWRWASLFFMMHFAHAALPLLKRTSLSTHFVNGFECAHPVLIEWISRRFSFSSAANSLECCCNRFVFRLSHSLFLT